MNKKYLTVIISAGMAVVFAAVVALPALAQTSTVTPTTTIFSGGVRAQIRAHENMAANASATAAAASALAARITNITTRADKEISRRVDALNALSARINAMARLSSTDKSSLSSSIQAQIVAMNTLQSQISTDAAANNTSSLKTDVQSITGSYRIFALILPQGSIEAAADRVITITGIMNDLSTKLSARIQTAQSAGNNVTAASASLTDLNAKIADATTQANAAVSEIATLVPDNGNATVMASNTAALKNAHTKILAAQQDFVTARADAVEIIKDLATFKVSATATTTASATAE
jgi:hypothetical protein